MTAKVCVFGAFGLGGFEMRGRPLEALGYELVNLREAKPLPKCDVGILVKYDLGRNIGDVCGTLIFDPLDCWLSAYPGGPRPEDYWQGLSDYVRADVQIATSESCQQVMADALRGVSEVVLIPHHADPQIPRNCGNPNGRVTYCGDLRYIESGYDVVREACDRVRRRFEVWYDWRGLQGAALNLHPRLPPHDTTLNRWCKPQVKVENAMQAGVPTLATPDPCVDDCVSFSSCWHDPERLAFDIEVALQRHRTREPFTQDQYLEAVRALVARYL